MSSGRGAAGAPVAAFERIPMVASGPERAVPIEVPYTDISGDALRGVVESFVLREGTEYGDRDVTLEIKVAQVIRQLQLGEAKILFDPESETIDIVVASGLRCRERRDNSAT